MGKRSGPLLLLVYFFVPSFLATETDLILIIM